MRISPPICVFAIIGLALGLSAYLRSVKQRSGSEIESVTLYPRGRLAEYYSVTLYPRGRLAEYYPVGRGLRQRAMVIQVSRNGVIEFRITDRPVGTFSDNQLQAGEATFLRQRRMATQEARDVVAMLVPIFDQAVPLADEQAVGAMNNGEGGVSKAGVLIHKCTREALHVYPRAVFFQPARGLGEQVLIAPGGCVDEHSHEIRRRIADAERRAMDALNLEIDPR